jgi:phage protein D
VARELLAQAQRADRDLVALQKDQEGCEVITQVRTARPSIVLGGADWFNQLAPYFLNCIYVDNCDGDHADDFQLQLADRDRRFISDWMPDVGTYFDAEIICERWFAPNAATLSLECGRFWIDSVDFLLPQHTVSIKASSIPTDQKLKGADETRGWENSSLQDVAIQIAGENMMILDWQALTNPKYQRLEQTEESGLSLLKKHANAHKLSLKVHKQSIVIFDEQKMESAAPAFTLLYGTAQGASASAAVYRMSGGDFQIMINDTVQSTRNSFSNMGTGMTGVSQFETGDQDIGEYGTDSNEDPGEDGEGGGEEGGEQRRPRAGLSGDWTSESDSTFAEAMARNKNKHKVRATIEMSIGNPLVAAGQTFDLKGVGQFDGKWFIETAEHALGPQYDTKLVVHKCLEGY